MKRGKTHYRRTVAFILRLISQFVPFAFVRKIAAICPRLTMLSVVQLQRQVMENYIKQKRATPGMVQANDLQILRPMSGSTAMSSAVPIAPAVRVSSGRELHAYDGPMQFMMSPNNPDQLSNEPISPSRDGKR